MIEIWPVIHAERAALVEDLQAVTWQQWSIRSLCPGWDVHDVLAHLVNDAKTTRLGFLRDFLAAGFDFDRLNALGVARERAEDPAETVERFCIVSGLTAGAAAPPATRLVEVFVHGEDIRRPLSIYHQYPTAQSFFVFRHNRAHKGEEGTGSAAADRCPALGASDRRSNRHAQRAAERAPGRDRQTEPRKQVGDLACRRLIAASPFLWTA